MDNIKDVLNHVIHKLSLRQPEEQSKIDRIWQHIASPKEQLHTSLANFTDGILNITVDSPAWMYHMKMQKGDILRRLKEEIPSVKDIRFKVGKVS